VSTDGPAFDPSRLVEVLDRHGVDYLIVGGFGSQLHGATRQTYDIDFVPSATADNEARLASALDELGARLRIAGMTDEEARQLPVVIDAATLRAFGSTTWMTDAGPLDILSELPVAGGYRAFVDLEARSSNVEFSGVVVRLASLDDIIDSKTHADRPKDREALPELHNLRTQLEP
jgi:hypothetical protein